MINYDRHIIDKNMLVYNKTYINKKRLYIWYVVIALGYAKPENAIYMHIDEEDKTTTLIQGNGSNNWRRI